MAGRFFIAKYCRVFVDRSPVLLWVILVVAVVLFLLLRYENAPLRVSELPSAVDAADESTVPGQNDQAESASNSAKSSTSSGDPRTSLQKPAATPNDKPKFKIVGLAPESERAPSSADPEQPAHEIPLGDLAISGRVLTHTGRPIAGAKVAATAKYLFEEGRRRAIPRGARERVSTTDSDGKYSFEKLANGEYHVSTAATERYGRALIQVRAGVDFADLIVATHQKIRVQGVVTNNEGEPLFGVKVRPNLLDPPEVTSNRDGRYGFDTVLPDDRTSLLVRATRAGYEDREVTLPTDESAVNSDVRELNIVMEPDDPGDFVKVYGSVKGSDGKAIIGRRVTLYSPSVRQNHRPTTDINGRYSITGVEPGGDYSATVNAPNGYKDHFQRNIVVPDKGLILNIELEQQETGVLRGQMVNVFGNAVADHSLVLQTVETSFYNQRVIGDRAGRFEVKNAPADELRLKSNSNPYYTIEGIRLAPGEERDVRIVLDWGYDEILGRIVDQDNTPVSVPYITLTWTHMENGIRTSVRRTAAADERGNFRFAQLGPGNHQLRVNAPGYRPATLAHDPSQQGSNLRVELVEQ